MQQEPKTVVGTQTPSVEYVTYGDPKSRVSWVLVLVLLLSLGMNVVLVIDVKRRADETVLLRDSIRRLEIEVQQEEVDGLYPRGGKIR